MDRNPMEDLKEVTHQAIRVPADLVARIDAAIPLVEADPDLRGMLPRVSRAAVLRVLVIRGLASLEAKQKRSKA